MWFNVELPSKKPTRPFALTLFKKHMKYMKAFYAILCVLPHLKSNTISTLEHSYTKDSYSKISKVKLRTSYYERQ